MGMLYRTNKVDERAQMMATWNPSIGLCLGLSLWDARITFFDVSLEERFQEMSGYSHPKTFAEEYIFMVYLFFLPRASSEINMENFWLLSMSGFYELDRTCIRAKYFHAPVSTKEVVELVFISRNLISTLHNFTFYHERLIVSTEKKILIKSKPAKIVKCVLHKSGGFCDWSQLRAHTLAATQEYIEPLIFPLLWSWKLMWAHVWSKEFASICWTDSKSGINFFGKARARGRINHLTGPFSKVEIKISRFDAIHPGTKHEVRRLKHRNLRATKTNRRRFSAEKDEVMWGNHLIIWPRVSGPGWWHQLQHRHDGQCRASSGSSWANEKLALPRNTRLHQ